jgi:hypothetical protein
MRFKSRSCDSSDCMGCGQSRSRLHPNAYLGRWEQDTVVQNFQKKNSIVFFSIRKFSPLALTSWTSSLRIGHAENNRSQNGTEINP